MKNENKDGKKKDAKKFKGEKFNCIEVKEAIEYNIYGGGLIREKYLIPTHSEFWRIKYSQSVYHIKWNFLGVTDRGSTPRF